MTIAKAPQAFPRTEHMRRLALVKAEMARREVDVLVVTSTANITYLTGNFSRIFAPHALVVAIGVEEPTVIVRAMDVVAFNHLTFLSSENVLSYSDEYVGKADKNGFDAIIDFLDKAGYSSRRVGIEFNGMGGLGMGVISPHNAEKIKSRLKKTVDCTKLIDWIRVIKSDLEIAVMREAAALADAAIMRAAEIIRPGVREADLAAEMVAVQVRGVPGIKPGTGLFPPVICSSPRTGTPHIMWSEDVFRDGSQVNIEVSGNRYSYMAAIMRTFIIGPPPDRLRKMHEAEMAGMEAALEVARPGNTASDVASAFYRVMEKKGLSKVSRCGYTMGVEWHEPVSLQLSDKTVLQPNMTFHLMLGNWVDDDFGYELSETIRITESNVEVLTKAPRKLFEL